ncbi:MAG: hypothetical protein A3D96_01905 [Chlamydiae bacterium RIFCSPHIGHO2_12_FULL_44_59]|nr:MAG: hypothetical protein A2796_04595 [Chlamydiae bacterium RIFCSPHIGHO2_01_FULL_44_39]OGN59298.1 MAG: hypothetical protein A3C42_04875 [Chlamydiae bacterium RIFCSPHIGHO2_02_FULL_45_9]OGN60664.1 MAG: hypothetical protein A3D96_01905 [Chlamydiae bacterium RIFCSPHIGHO2_12_FULL_44_59]OGN66924.1 MAG: hypothetical protein A2978_02135 [Chlamydiae bacterium RIFCSPLOWO2_01_FULL_44_52]OGN67476.1 MAG: hypothetical protein A3I67_03350 [Chlamydiae bacterium RIFCSPLOWO2_02_FULL_45_22]OGN71177.1 MAG: hyp
MEKKGWIALDIDGTITLDKYSVPQEVTQYLRKKVQEGWSLLMTTGRPYTFASMALSQFDFPYFFSLQNGSLVMTMPSKKVLLKRDIPDHAIAFVEQAYHGIPSDFVIYAGYELGDFCYWRPRRFSPEELHYLEDVQKRQKESWKAVDVFEQLAPGHFPLIKCFGNEPRMKQVKKKLEETGKFQLAKIRDPFVEGCVILLVTDEKASKGNAFIEVLKKMGREGVIIAAGDDENDISLLNVADVKIAMHHAPESLQRVASFIAPPTRDLGIIQALEIVTR